MPERSTTGVRRRHASASSGRTNSVSIIRDGRRRPGGRPAGRGKAYWRKRIDSEEGQKNRAVVVELTKEGYGLLKRNKLDGAEGRLRAALVIEPDNAYALSGMADAAGKRGDFQAALDLFSACLERHSNDGDALFGRGDCRRGFADLPRAIEIRCSLPGRERRRTAAPTSIAGAYRTLLDFDRSGEFHAETPQLDAHCLHAVKGFGHPSSDMKTFHDGFAYRDGALRRDGTLAEDAEVPTAAGDCRRRAFEFAEALPRFERAAAPGPEGFTVDSGLTDRRRGPGDFEASELYFNRTLEPGDNLSARPGMIRILKKAGCGSDALRRLEELDERHPGNRRVRNEMTERRSKLRQADENDLQSRSSSNRLIW